MRIVVTCLLVLLMAAQVLGQQSKRLQAGDFKTSSDCKQCHEQIHTQWTTSLHSQAYTNPVYQSFLRHVDQEKQGKLTAFCVSCHAPLATLTRTVPAKLFDGQPKPALLQEGVSCEFCHTISGSEVELRKLSLGAYLFPRAGQTRILYGR